MADGRSKEQGCGKGIRQVGICRWGYGEGIRAGKGQGSEGAWAREVMEKSGDRCDEGRKRKI